MPIVFIATGRTGYGRLMEGRIVLLRLFSHLVLQRIDEFIALLVVEFLVSEAHHLIGYPLILGVAGAGEVSI